MDLCRGQRVSIAEISKCADIECVLQIELFIAGLHAPIDFACFGLNTQQCLVDEQYMVFYNQPISPCNSIKLTATTEDTARFSCHLAELPNSIHRLVFTATLNATQTMHDIKRGYFRFTHVNQELARFSFTGADFQAEKALILGEMYRKDNTWRFSATGQGFNGGLAALVKHFGGEVKEEVEPIHHLETSTNKLSLEKKIATVAPKLIDLAKKATLSLEKYKLSATVAHVGLVLDASGSMYAQYDKGKMQQVIDRLLPLAVHFDDDSALNVWAFSNKTRVLPVATLENYADYIATAEYGWRNWGLMSTNNEPAIIEQVIQYYQNTTLPVFIIFISDGGINQNAAIKKLLIDAATRPIFWQFVGIGGRNYGVLEKLDTLSGRVVDNCGFFALDDINSINEQQLYERLLNEFPRWLEAAKLKAIVH